MTRFPDWTAAEVALAAKLDRASFDYIPKTADESVNSGGTGTTLQNDNHLAATIGETGTYVFDLWLWMNSAANAAGDIKIGFTFPTATCHFTAIGLDTSLASSFTGTMHTQGVNSATSGTTALALGLSTSTTVGHVHGVLIATATGTLQMQWAQNASNANNSTILAGSHMIVKQYA